METSIDAYRTEDRDRVLALADRLATGVAPWRNPRDVERVVRGWVAEALDETDPATAPVWVARQRGQVVGFVHAGTRRHWAGDEDAYVGELVVSEEAAGGGLGRQLMMVAEAWARDRGHSRLTLETGQGNEGARAFYAALGYVVEEVVLTRDLTT